MNLVMESLFAFEGETARARRPVWPARFSRGRMGDRNRLPAGRLVQAVDSLLRRLPDRAVPLLADDLLVNLQSRLGLLQRLVDLGDLEQRVGGVLRGRRPDDDPHVLDRQLAPVVR